MVELIEIRELDGPNLFDLQPVIKVELKIDPDESLEPARLATIATQYELSLPADPIDAFELLIGYLHVRLEQNPPAVGRRSLDIPGHLALFYPWTWDTFAQGVARAAFLILTEPDYPDPTERLRAALERDRQRESRPLWIRDSERTKPVVSITGTNGKTTTTRLLAHIFQNAGRSVGWTTTAGVYINGECVLEGDYTGPSGARRVLRDPDVDIAILETARGGILLRGVAYESNDVGVMLNVSPDHLSLQGVETIETLAEVKGVVVRLTRPEGTVVLNADDPLVFAQKERVSAPVMLISQHPDRPEVVNHVRSGGQGIISQNGKLVLLDGTGRRTELVEWANVPVTLAGAAKHMIENAMAATGAALSLGLSTDQIVAGLTSFRSDSSLNAGRMNIFAINNRKVIVDYAHNEKGLEALAIIARAIMDTHCGQFHIVAGTAGDRQDEVLIAIGMLSVESADKIYLKDNPGYLRGRKPGEVMIIMQQGIEQASGLEKLVGSYPDEHSAFQAALENSNEHDVIAIMCQEQQNEIFNELTKRGAVEQ